MERKRSRILCVDDDPRILEGLQQLLGRRYDVVTAPSGAAGLQTLRGDRSIVAVISDMRMPGMDGAAFLTQARTVAPNVGRIILSGEMDVQSAIAAVNDGQVHKVLLKPCPPPELHRALEQTIARFGDARAPQGGLHRAGSDGVHCVEYRHRLLSALREAIDTDALHLHYQPIIDLNSGRVRSLEALARWRHTTFGQVSPADFVKLAEESGEMPRLGQRILRRACREARQILGRLSARMAVNISMQQLEHADFLADLEDVLRVARVRPQELELELTESVFSHDAEQALATLTELRARGIRIAIDDFGTGYSSLAYLQHFRPDSIKVDRTFVSSLGKGGETIIAAALSIGRDFGMDVVIEGVETVLQQRRLTDLGATLMQGYLYARPMALSELDRWFDGLHAQPAVAIGDVQRS